MPQSIPSWGQKGSFKGRSKKGADISNPKGKSKQVTFKGKQKAGVVFGGKGKAKGYGKVPTKGSGKKRKQSRRLQKVSPVSRHTQPAFQTNLDEKTSRKRLQDPPLSRSGKRTRTVPVAIPRAGMPVPPAKYLGNAERMRVHEMKLVNKLGVGQLRHT